jgi:hypothetical protein
MRATSPAHLILLDLITLIIKNMELYIMQFSSASRHFIPLGSDIILGSVFSDTLNLYSSLNARDHVSHPYKTTGELIVFYILIFSFLDSRREDGRF